jgi:hypothetical protein
LVIPARAIRADGDKRIVRLKQGDRFVDTEIRTGLANDLQTEVVGGLKEGDVIAARANVPAKTGSGD